ncbi:MAG: hypothetical protein EPO55_10760 [Reyranella sp.]|uniref:hypothetical protein n=1 Tax=Reyranella sp. TaxID=1929291 RepID=UPI001202AFEB|nr:hypothetical protein [Reyranella sp.]TAJ39958.1 MAG: hypothetical protein EPO55_10760 [Reyranella sp.]
MPAIKKLPILATIPRSGTWFLRYAVSFLIHLDRGGCVKDRLTGEVVGRPSGLPFDFPGFRGGPLFHAQHSMPHDHLFIGHTVCPGFAGSVTDLGWWGKTAFHVPGYDYLHEGLNYAWTPIDLADDVAYTPLSVPALDRSAAVGRSAPMALVYRNPLAQAASYFRYCVGHPDRAYNTLDGQPLARVPFRDYLFGSALPSWAKQFVSFQAMAAWHRGLVRLVPYEHLMDRPVEILADLLNHLQGTARCDWRNLHHAVRLARREHLRAIETELGRSLDGTRAANISHMRSGRFEETLHDRLRDEVIQQLQWMGVDTDLIVWSAADNRDYFQRQEGRVATE